MAEPDLTRIEAGRNGAEEELRRTCELLRAVADETPDAIFVKDRDGKYLLFNRAASRLTGKPAAEVLGRDDTALFDPESARVVMESDRQVMASGVAETREEELTAAGVARTYLATKIPYRDDRGIVGVIGISRDITDRKQHEAALREREDLYRLLTENANDFIRLQDPAARSIYASPSVKRLYGGVPTTLFEFAHPEDVEACRRWWDQVLAGGGRLLNWRVRNKDGTERWLETRGSIVPHQGKPHVMTVCRDITDRMRAEDALRKSEHKLNEAQRIAHLGYWEHDFEADRVSWSDETGRILGLPPDESGRPAAGLRELIHPDDRPIFDEAITRALRGESDDYAEYRIVRPDGEVRYVRNIVDVTRDAAGQPRRAFGAVQDVTERRRAEDALRKRDRLLRQLLDALPVGVVVTDLSGDILLGNPASERIWGGLITDGAERWARSKGWWHGTGKRIGPDEWASRRASTQGLTSVNELIDIETFEGVRKTIENSAAPIRDDDGTIFGAVVINADVTDRMRGEDALRASEHKLNEAQRIAHLGHWEQDLDTGRITASDETHRIFGVRPQEGLKTWEAWQEHLHPEDRPTRAAAIDRALREGLRYEAEYRVVRPDGDTRIIHSQGEVSRNGAGQPRRLFGIIRDITERKNSERALLKAERRLEHVVASSPAVLFTVPAEDGEFRRISWMSENIEAVLGYRVEETLGGDWWLSSIHPENRDAVVTQFRSEIVNSSSFSAEYRFRHEDGRYRWIRGESRLLLDAAGQPAEIVGSLSDITERKGLEDQFRQSQKMDAFGQLAGGVAHDFNNLLTIINGYSDLLLGNLPPNDPNRELVAEIHKAGERSAGLTRQLLAFSRQQVLAPRVLDLNAVVGDTASMLRRVIGEDVTLSTTTAPALWLVKADRGQFEQVLLNLAVNARDAMATGGRLTIETRNVVLDEAYAASHLDARPGPHVLLAVSDTGCGMTAAVRAKSFEPFFTTKAAGKGTGLGLATVYGIVKQSGGHVAVDSEVGVGTTFKVYLPRTEQAAGGSKIHAAVLLPPRGTETVLVVEDDAAVRTLTRHILRKAGYTVLEASGGDEALRVAAGHTGTVHLLVTDVVMPGLGGRAVAERLTERNPGLRVLFVSGYTDDAVVRRGVLHDQVNFLQKPFTPAALAWKVREVLDVEP